MPGSEEKTVPTICVFSGNEAGWRWYEEDSRGQVRWIFHDEEPKNFIERRIRRPRLSRIFGALRCIQSAEGESAVAIAAHSQFCTMWTAILLRLLGNKRPLLSFSFHFSKLPTGARLLIAKWAFSRVTRFCVHSGPERLRYARHFGLPVDRFEMIHWGVHPSSVEVADAPAPYQGPYICALGKDGRDYATLIEAMTSLPDMALIVVVQPYNLAGIEIPANVMVKFNIPREEALNVLKHSQFMALPLESNETSCGHITLVSAMFCGKAIVATRSTGIADYFPPDYGAPTVAAGDVNGWVEALRTMDGDTKRLERCADAGQKFSRLHCSHNAAFLRTMEFIRRAGVEIPRKSP